MMRYIVLFFILSISLPAIAQDSQECLEKALALYEEKDFKRAASYFEKYAPSSKLLRDYVCFWWATSLRETGKEQDAMQLYDKVPNDSPIRKKAVEELAFFYGTKGDWLSSIKLLRERIKLEEDKRSEPFWQNQALKIGYFSGDPSLAISNFKKLIKDFPEAKEALEALEKYDNFYSFKGDEISMAKVYLIHKAFRKVLGCLEDGPLDKLGKKLQAEAYYGLKDYDRAISILERLVKEEADAELKLRLGEIYLSGPHAGKGLSILEELAREKEGSRFACLSLWKLLNYWKGKDDEEKTKIYCRKLKEGYREFSLTDKAIWLEGWMDMSRKDYAEADRAWQVFDNISRNSREKLSALYLRRWIRLSSDNKSDAEKILKRLASLYPDTYYGMEAFRKDLHTKKIGVGVKLGELGRERDFDRARALLDLGRDEEVIFELEALKKKRYNDINLRYNLSLIYGRTDRFNEAIHEAASLIDFLKETGRWPGFLNLSEERLTKINFPRFYQKEIEKRAGEFKLDKNLIYAVIREESRFNKEDVSPSGAIGLMQILPSTGNWIMEKVNLKAATEDLFDPEINIFLGSWYLRYLLDKFNGDLLLAIASYNGGPGLIERWVKAGGLNNRDIAIEMMPKEETKYYCQKVLFSYHMYGRIYPVPPRVQGVRK